jgi:hypothetical protein
MQRKWFYQAPKECCKVEGGKVEGFGKLPLLVKPDSSEHGVQRSKANSRTAVPMKNRHSFSND